jgi:hypothetical protein
MDGGRPRRGRVHDALGQAFAASTCARLLTRALSHAHTRTAELDALKCTAGRARTREDARGREGAWMKMQLTSALRASRTPWHGGEDAPARSARCVRSRMQTFARSRKSGAAGGITLMLPP